MRIYISGGCKNGKSLHAQRLVKQMPPPLYYVATMRPKDGEDSARILAHQDARAGWGFETVEAPEDIVAALAGCDENGAFLLDSVTALLENEMFRPDGIFPDAYKKVADDLLAVVGRLRNIVLVSDFICSDAFLYTDLVEHYRRSLAYIDRQLALACDSVLEVCGGEIVEYKGVGSEGGLCS